MEAIKDVGFIGLGVMGEPMCRNLATKTQLRIRANDLSPEPLKRLAAQGVESVADIAQLAQDSQVIFLSLPSGEVVHQLSHQQGGLLASTQAGQIVVDLSTSPAKLTRELAGDFAAKGVQFIDAPVARSRLAAEAGTLSCMVGAEPEIFERVKPLLATFATDIALCGAVGCGQVVKILNNYLLYQAGAALAEAAAIGERSGIAPALLFDVLSKGSADSFAVRHHGIKAIAPRDFPLRSFSVEYARKDMRYAIELANSVGLDARWGHDVDGLFEKAIEAGHGDEYWPVISRLFDTEAVE